MLDEKRNILRNVALLIAAGGLFSVLAPLGHSDDGSSAPPSPTPTDLFVRGDVDLDGDVNPYDAIALLSALGSARGSIPLPCHDAADANDDGVLSEEDAMYLLGFMFTGGPPPLPPYFACGIDPSVDNLGCAVGPWFCP